MLKSLPFQLIICIILAYVIGSHLDLTTIRGFYALSCVLKNGLMFLLPAVIFSYIATAIIAMGQRGPILIISVILLVCLSNLTAVFASYATAQVFLPWLSQGKLIASSAQEIMVTPLFELELPQLLSPGKSMIAGMVTGLTLSLINQPKINHGLLALRDLVTAMLRKGFIPLLPVYVFGFVLKMQQEGDLIQLFGSYSQVLLVSCGLILTYLALLYGIGTQFRPKVFLEAVRSMVPAGITGFSTMSSAATMPVTLAAVEKNVQDQQFAQFVIPTTVNIHLLGDALGIPLLGMAMLTLSGNPLPDLGSFLIFAAYFCLAKFSTAGIPGGGVLVLLPTLQEHLGLTPEMSGLVATLYILQDCLFTSSNVMGNGAFALIAHRLLKGLGIVRIQPINAA